MRLKELREERNLTQKEVGDAIMSDQSNVARWEKGINQPSAEFVLRLAEYFGVTTDYLLGADEWTAEERAQGVIDHKKISVSADEETLIECYRTMGRKFGKKKQENFIKLAELYAEEEG